MTTLGGLSCLPSEHQPAQVPTREQPHRSLRRAQRVAAEQSDGHKADAPPLRHEFPLAARRQRADYRRIGGERTVTSTTRPPAKCKWLFPSTTSTFSGRSKPPLAAPDRMASRRLAKAGPIE